FAFTPSSPNSPLLRSKPLFCLRRFVSHHCGVTVAFCSIAMGNRGWRRSCHVGWQVLLLFSHIAYRDERYCSSSL
ncbi:unnamed protein product, partial [Musa textilis]